MARFPLGGRALAEERGAGTAAATYASMAFVNVKTYGATGNGVTDDTAAINSALTAASAVGQGVFVPAGVYAISGLVDVPAPVALVGAGSGDYTVTTGTVFKATNAAAHIRFGDPLVVPQAGGVSGQFKVNGNSLATLPCTISTVGGIFQDIKVINSAGDGILFDGAQNCVATSCSPVHSQLCGVAFDRGASGNLLIKWEIQSNSTWMVEFRMTAANGPLGAVVPQYNQLLACGIENIGSPVWSTAGLGLVHSLAGSNNCLVKCGMSDGLRTAAGDAVLIEPNTQPGRAGDGNDRLTFTDCGWSGGSNHALNVNAVHVLGNPPCTNVICFSGYNEINNYGTGVLLSATAAGNVATGFVDMINVGTKWSGGLYGIQNQVQTLTGKMFNQFAGLELTTATAGVNGAPPAQVVGYLQFVDSTGTNRKIPYYAT